MKHWVIGRTRALHIQFLRYFFVGGTSAVVDLFIFTVLVKYLHAWYVVAAFLGYMFGLAWNYGISIVWVFERRHSRLQEIIMVVSIAIGGLLWTWAILYLLITLLGMDAVIAKMLSQIIVLAWNFGMRKVYVFE